jgi:hypothetical protein
MWVNMKKAQEACFSKTSCALLVLEGKRFKDYNELDAAGGLWQTCHFAGAFTRSGWK